jgi:YcxB-like protein
MKFKISYNKAEVIQGLRYHFISRREIKLMIILVNVFALFSAGLFAWKKISPMAFLISSLLWFVLMIVFWYVLPMTIYKRSATFKDRFTVSLEENHMYIETEKGSRTWAWREFSEIMETPRFFHLYFDPRSFFLLPKGAIDPPEKVVEVRRFLKEKIKGR